ncbi:DUF3679 domain-containing protein [Laceyella putida]|uniref:DUF3679 domain-containing protein n=1 Tax=Laceyella putida TaxID=110101 RepID=A0ABW2RI61_9BACL
MRVMVQCCFLVIMLMVGIGIGINQAEKNMQMMQGADGAPRAIQITPTEQGRIEIAVLGQTVKTQSPASVVNQEKVDKVATQVKQGTNIMAVMGNEMGEGIRQITRELAEWVFRWAD